MRERCFASDVLRITRTPLNKTLTLLSHFGHERRKFGRQHTALRHCKHLQASACSVAHCHRFTHAAVPFCSTTASQQAFTGVVLLFA